MELCDRMKCNNYNHIPWIKKHYSTYATPYIQYSQQLIGIEICMVGIRGTHSGLDTDTGSLVL